MNKQGETLDFYLSQKCNEHAVYQFSKRCLRPHKQGKQPNTLNSRMFMP